MTFLVIPFLINGQEHSIARKWMDTLLEMIKVDGQGPTIEAINISHMTVGMYDAWAIFDEKAETFLLWKIIRDF